MEVKNVVATAKCNPILDLDLIHSLLPHDLSYRSSCFGSLNLKDDVRTVFQLFSNGSVVVIGGNDANEAKDVFDSYISYIDHLGLGIVFSDYRVRNIIATYKHSNRINLPQLAQKGFSYEPEIFPAVRYRNENLKVTVNIFHTGSCVFLGANDFATLSLVVSEIKELLCSV